MTFRLKNARIPLLSLLLCTLVACLPTARVRPGPPSLGLGGRATYARYLAEQPRELKMRHQVATQFGPHSEVVEGYCVLARPDQFWIRATTPMGGTLFEVRSTTSGGLLVESALTELQDARAPLYLARDIRRIYLHECPADATLVPTRSGFRVSCPLAGAETPIEADDGLDRPDDALALLIGEGGVVWEKTFYRGGEATAQITYDDYQRIGNVWLPHRITLESRGALYTLTIALVAADPAFDTSALFGGQAN